MPLPACTGPPMPSTAIPRRFRAAPSMSRSSTRAGNAYTWQDSGWSFCESEAAGSSDAFCPSGFINFGPGYRGAADGYVYLFGSSPRAAARRRDEPPAARTYLARVPRRATPDARRLPVFRRTRRALQASVERRCGPHASGVHRPQRDAGPGCGGRCAMAGMLEDAVYDAGLGALHRDGAGRQFGADLVLRRTASVGPLDHHRLQQYRCRQRRGRNGGNLGLAAGGSLGVHAVNAWTSADGLTMWMGVLLRRQGAAGSAVPAGGQRARCVQSRAGGPRRGALRARAGGVTNPARRRLRRLVGTRATSCERRRCGRGRAATTASDRHAWPAISNAVPCG